MAKFEHKFTIIALVDEETGEVEGNFNLVGSTAALADALSCFIREEEVVRKIVVGALMANPSDFVGLKTTFREERKNVEPKSAEKNHG